MIYLIASIISSTAIYVVFRIAKNYAVKLTPLITINYLAAGLLGFVFLMKLDLKPVLQQNTWLPFSILLGVLFILMFYLIGISSQKAGITITTLASKMSLVFPVFFSLYWFGETVSFYKYLGLVMAILAVLLTVYKKNEEKLNRTVFLLPMAIFVGGGLIDSIIKLVQEIYITGKDTSSFTTCVFFTAFFCGIIFSAVKEKKINLRLNRPTLVLGVLLGLANFGSLIFLIYALEKSNLESSLVFALNNMLIVIVSAMLGKFIFKEQINKVNLAGFVLAILCLIILL